MIDFGEKVGSSLHGGEVIELFGDVGAGKTTFVKGLAKGMGIDDEIQSPTFTISRVYQSPRGVTLAHYDFYRLNNPGILNVELDEALHEQGTVTVIEWAEIVSGVLPDDRLIVNLGTTGELSRSIELKAGGAKSQQVISELKK